MIMRAAILISAMLLAASVPAISRNMSPKDVDALPASEPIAVVPYGSDPLQVGELRLPKGKGPFPVAIVVHGGCWTKGFATRRNTAAMASALTDKGVATWNIEYRQLGDPGAGWPGTFRDWAAGADHLRSLARRYPLDLKRVVAVGHSAGAHAALWIAARHKLPRASEVRGANPLRVKAAVAIDGPGDLAPFRGFDAEVCGKPAIDPLLGGSPEAQPQRYEQATPKRLLPLGRPQYLVATAVLTPKAADDYRKAAAAGGDKVEVVAPAGADHFNIIAPGEPQWAEVEAVILRAVR
jgi:acetyl esterase/lipase